MFSSALLLSQGHPAPALGMPGFPSPSDSQPPADVHAAAQRAGTWAESQYWLVADPSGSRLPGLWYPPTGAPSDTLNPLPFDPLVLDEVAIFAAGEPLVHLQLPS